MTLAIREINAEEGRNNQSIRTFRIALAGDDIVNSRCNPASSKPIAQLLLKRNRTLAALLGVDCSGVFKAISHDYAQAKVSDVLLLLSVTPYAHSLLFVDCVGTSSIVWVG